MHGHLPFHSSTPPSLCCIVCPLFDTTGRCNSPHCVKINGMRVIPPPRAKITVNEGGGGPIPSSCVVFEVVFHPGGVLAA